MSFVLKSPVPRIDQVGVEERASTFQKRSIKNEAKAIGLKLAVSMMDLTTLEGADTKGKVLDVSDARAAEGVVAVLTAQDLLDAGVDTGMAFSLAPAAPGTKSAAPKRPVPRKCCICIFGLVQ